jgi:hypothetical protein
VHDATQANALAKARQAERNLSMSRARSAWELADAYREMAPRFYGRR